MNVQENKDFIRNYLEALSGKPMLFSIERPFGKLSSKLTMNRRDSVMRAQVL
jgi:hypothetical protein